MLNKKQLSKISELDHKITQSSKGIKILGRLSWPAEVGADFLKNWKQKRKKLPKIQHPKHTFTAEVQELQEINRNISEFKNTPLGTYLEETAKSYIAAARMLESAGTKDFVRFSSELYGRPDAKIGNGNLSHLHAAEHFIKLTSEYVYHGRLAEDKKNLSPTIAARKLQEMIVPIFGKKNTPSIEIDPSLASKAVAGSKRIRLRKAAKFSELEIKQLAQHEAFIHSLTLKNGLLQKNLPTLGLGSPRTTRTQEGLASLAEMITMTMEIGRLRRLALRTKAVHQALEGADFIEIFQLFLDSGQSELESFYSSMRVFRGGDVKGGIAFTKDIVYLQGLIDVHHFMRKSIRENNIEHLHLLFAGRMDCKDVAGLKPYFESKFIKEPSILPPWADSMECLASHFSYLAFAHELDFTSFYESNASS